MSVSNRILCRVSCFAALSFSLCGICPLLSQRVSGGGVFCYTCYTCGVQVGVVVVISTNKRGKRYLRSRSCVGCWRISQLPYSSGEQKGKENWGSLTSAGS